MKRKEQCGCREPKYKKPRTRTEAESKAAMLLSEVRSLVVKYLDHELNIDRTIYHPKEHCAGMPAIWKDDMDAGGGWSIAVRAMEDDGSRTYERNAAA